MVEFVFGDRIRVDLESLSVVDQYQLWISINMGMCFIWMQNGSRNRARNVVPHFDNHPLIM